MVNKDTFVGFKVGDHPHLDPPWFCVSFIAPWWRNGCFQRPPSFQLL